MSRVIKTVVLLFQIVFIISCQEDAKKKYSVCNRALGACPNNGAGKYCTFGYKWGGSNPFSEAGFEKPGPGVKAPEISYKFLDGGVFFSTHSQDNVTSIRFVDCVKEEVRSALAEWQSVAGVGFVEKASRDKTDVTIILANVEQGGIGYPALTGEPCSQVAGYLILNIRSGFNSCHNLYFLALHEAGHVLGLGHITSDNVMNPYKTYDHLQPGDIEGIKSIYGGK